MSKKKKNIRRKKSNNLLKGMAAAGAVVGGGTIFAGNNAVYAAENEQGVIQSEEQIIESQSVSESTTESLSQSKSETSSFESEGAVETSAVEGNTVQTNQKAFVKRAPRFFNNAQAQGSDEQNIMLADETGNEKAVNENGAEQEAASLSVSGSVSGSISGSISEVGSQISSESISGSEAESKMASESLSTSTSTEDFKSESERLSTSVSTSASLSTSTETSTYTSESESLSKEFTSASESFETQKNQTLEDLITNINNTKRELEEIRQDAIKDNHHYLNGAYQNDAYRKKADELAKYLAQYNFFQKYGVGKVTEISTQYNNNGVNTDNNGNYTQSTNYKRNNFFVKYQTADNKEYTGYFDWVAVTEKKDVYGNTLKDEKGNILYEYTPYEKTDPLDVVQIAVIEKAPIYSDDSWDNRDNHGSKFYYYERNGKIHAYFSKKDIKYWDYTSGRYNYQPDFKEIESFSKGDITSENGSEIEFNYNGSHYRFIVKTETNGGHVFPYFGQVEDDLNIDASSPTTIKGKSYFSIKDFEKQQTKYDKQRSEFTSISEKQSRHKSDSIKNSQSKSESLSLSISNSNSKSNVDTSDSLSKSKSLSLVNSDIASRSNSHSSLESTEISKSLLNSQSTSTSVSESQSTSTSVSES